MRGKRSVDRDRWLKIREGRREVTNRDREVLESMKV